MDNVSRDLLGLQYEADILEAYGMLKEWISKSDNESLTQMAETIFRIDSYIRALHLERHSFDKIISETVKDKNRAVKRATRSEEKVEELEKQIEQLKLKLSLYE